MTTLLTFRDSIKEFYSRYDYILTPIVKFILSFVVLRSLNSGFGYWNILDNTMLMVLISAVCAFLPIEVLAGISGVIIALQSFKVSIDVGALAVAVIIIFYSAYMRFVPKTGVIVVLVPLCYTLHLTYALPILLGFLIGPAAIIPAAFGFILYYYEGCLAELVKVLAAATEEDEAVQGFQYVINALIDNKEMFLVIAVCAIVILITYCIYRLPVEHSWIAAFVAGGFFNVVLFLAGSVLAFVDVDIVPVIVGSVIGILIALFLQFCKGIVDYQRTEILQFEDDEYYYYVKAIPKLSVSGTNKNIKHINSKTSN